MTIPALSTSDKSFICSYSIGANVDFRLASGVMNEITTYTTEYIDGKCWIPVFAPTETNDHSNFWDLPDKDVVYVKIGCRISSDGYIHTWLLDTQKVSELILWNNRYNTTNQPEDDTTSLHWSIEKLYRQVVGNTTGFIPTNIKFQNYVGGSIRLYLFGTYSNSITNGVRYSIDHPTNVLKSSVSWYPNNSTSIFGDYLYSSLAGSAQDCNKVIVGTDHLMDDTFDALILYSPDDLVDPYKDYTSEANSDSSTTCPLYPENTFEYITGNGFAVYIGNDCKFIGAEFDITQTISGAGVYSWYSWNGSSWVPLQNLTNTTNGFKSTGVGTITFTEPTTWEKTTTDGKNMYFIKGIAWGETRRQPHMRTGHMIRPDGWVNFADNFSKETEPAFYKRTTQTDNIDIVPVCHPTDPFPPTMYRQWINCHVRGGNIPYSAFGNNSGRVYQLEDPPTCTACDDIPCICIAEKISWMSMEQNRAYIWVDEYCSGGTGSTQSACEADGGTWVPGHYECDPSFTYDTSVSYDIERWIAATSSNIDYSEGRAQFSCAGSKDEYLAVCLEQTVIDKFSEYVDGDLDELKHVDFTITNIGVVTNEIRSIFTKHVGVALITFSTAPTFYTTDWIINWGSNDYFDSWATPDGLAIRNPGSTQVLITRPLTHHDSFNTTGLDIEGGFIYDQITSNAFLSRTIDNETKINIPLCHNTEFCWRYIPTTSNGFLSRSIDVESKIDTPLSDNTGFKWIYQPTISDAFLSRTIDNETKINNPLCSNCGFCWVYDLEEPWVSKHRFLKVGGNDADDGLTFATAWENWSYAMANVKENGRLYAGHGTYSESVEMSPERAFELFLIDIAGDDEPAEVTITPA